MRISISGFSCSYLGCRIGHTVAQLMLFSELALTRETVRQARRTKKKRSPRGGRQQSHVLRQNVFALHERFRVFKCECLRSSKQAEKHPWNQARMKAIEVTSCVALSCRVSPTVAQSQYRPTGSDPKGSAQQKSSTMSCSSPPRSTACTATQRT